MKFKRLVSICLALFLSILSVPLIVNAHPGRTNSNGGHTDHSTGEYHYHHGYDDHQHYDMNGDGVDDCPYLFGSTANQNRSSNHDIPTVLIVYGIYCVGASVAAVILMFASDDAGKRGKWDLEKKLSRFFSFFMWTALPLALPLLALTGVVIEISSFIGRRIKIDWAFLSSPAMILLGGSLLIMLFIALLIFITYSLK